MALRTMVQKAKLRLWQMENRFLAEADRLMLQSLPLQKMSVAMTLRQMWAEIKLMTVSLLSRLMARL